MPGDMHRKSIHEEIGLITPQKSTTTNAQKNVHETHERDLNEIRKPS